jgi:hypothetical protein
MTRRQMSRLVLVSITLVLLLVATPAAMAAKPQITVEKESSLFLEWVEKEKECELGTWQIYLTYRVQTIEFPDGRLRVNGNFRGPFTYEDINDVTYTGRFAGNFSERLNDRTEVSRFNETIVGRGDDGSQLLIMIRFKLIMVNGEPVVEFDEVRC